MLSTTLCGSSLPVLQSQLLLREAGIVHFSTMRRGVPQPAPSPSAIPSELSSQISSSSSCLDNPSEPSSPYDYHNLCTYTGDDPVRILSARQQFADALSLPVQRLWFPRQVHGTDILVVDDGMIARHPDLVLDAAGAPTCIEAPRADVVITLTKDLLIGVSTADCVPVLLAVPGRGVAAIHAGWRGAVAHIVRKALEQLLVLTGAAPDEVLAVVGPSISPAAFEVGEEVATEFCRAGFVECVIRPPFEAAQAVYAQRNVWGGHAQENTWVDHGQHNPHVDLWQTVTMDLIQAGVAIDHVDCTPLCTYTNHEYLFSARRLGIKSGRIVSCIMMK